MGPAIVRIAGKDLVEFVNEWMVLINRGEVTRTDMIKNAGYLNKNGTPAYVDFYTELLKAKEADPSYVARVEAEDAEYSDLSGVEQDLYDAIQEKFGEKWDHEQIMGFMKELDDIGITTPEDLDDAYEWQTDSYRAEEDFAEFFITEALCETIPSCVEGCIDWQRVWDSSLRYDYCQIEYDDETFFFRNI